MTLASFCKREKKKCFKKFSIFSKNRKKFKQWNSILAQTLNCHHKFNCKSLNVTLLPVDSCGFSETTILKQNYFHWIITKPTIGFNSQVSTNSSHTPKSALPLPLMLKFCLLGPIYLFEIALRILIKWQLHFYGQKIQRH